MQGRNRRPSIVVVLFFACLLAGWLAGWLAGLLACLLAGLLACVHACWQLLMDGQPRGQGKYILLVGWLICLSVS